jgi:hypothetical protein
MRNNRDDLRRRIGLRFLAAWTLALALVVVLGMSDSYAATGSPSSDKKSKGSAGKKANHSARGRSKSASKKVSKRGSGKRAKVARGRRGRGSRNKRSYVAARTPQGPDATAAGISSDRAAEIQNALIKRGYLDGPASGQWDEVTQEAVRHFQSDNRLPVTGTPSAHFLKRLGVSQRPADGYAVPVARATDKDKGKERESSGDKKPPEK